MKNTYTFLLNCGYAEDAHLAFLPFSSREKYATAKEALTDLAVFLKDEYVKRNTPKRCCEASRTKEPTAAFCGKCGGPLADAGFDPEGYMHFVSEIAGCNVDSFHGGYIDYDETLRWQSEGIEKALDNGSIRVVYIAEKVLAAAIGHSPDERVSIESIFKGRTKSSGSSFSFW